MTTYWTTYRYEDALLLLERLELLQSRRHPIAVISQGSGSLGNGRISTVEESVQATMTVPPSYGRRHSAQNFREYAHARAAYCLGGMLIE